MKITTSSSVRWVIALCCAAGTFLLTPASYARRPHAKFELSREDRREDKGKRESRNDKDRESRNDKDKDSRDDHSPDKGDR
jgi:hypothetical protein